MQSIINTTTKSLDNINQTIDGLHTPKNQCIIHGYITEFGVLLTVGIVIFYFFVLKNAISTNPTKTFYDNSVAGFPKDNVTMGLFFIEAIYLLYISYQSYVKPFEGSKLCSLKFAFFGVLLLFVLFETNRADATHTVPPLLILPLTITALFYSLHTVHKYRICSEVCQEKHQ